MPSLGADGDLSFERCWNCVHSVEGYDQTVTRIRAALHKIDTSKNGLVDGNRAGMMRPSIAMAAPISLENQPGKAMCQAASMNMRSTGRALHFKRGISERVPCTDSQLESLLVCRRRQCTSKAEQYLALPQTLPTCALHSHREMKSAAEIDAPDMNRADVNISEEQILPCPASPCFVHA